MFTDASLTPSLGIKVRGPLRWPARKVISVQFSGSFFSAFVISAAVASVSALAYFVLLKAPVADDWLAVGARLVAQMKAPCPAANTLPSHRAPQSISSRWLASALPGHPRRWW